ncbi:hypothetical protein FEE96_23280 [Parasedimentitalea maritima]|uniref:Transporter n=1 Tax=Parasedimentitalea maritima TaxID=2578117 RepID=A0ABY2UN80_9RHOB|nr:hypothetical protein [Zongyanglinia marina]TLP54969.1 hypothetical protein FEE96_23280 [Zongyanglinia marina]
MTTTPSIYGANTEMPFNERMQIETQVLSYAATEATLGIEATKNMLEMQADDVSATRADTGLLQDLTGITAQVNVASRVARFVAWYQEYNQA